MTCNGDANVRDCPSTTCAIASYVVKNNSYNSDCYVNGKPVNINNIINSTWYRINLKAGGYGYVSAHYCSGGLPACSK